MKGMGLCIASQLKYRKQISGGYKQVRLQLSFLLLCILFSSMRKFTQVLSNYGV